MAILKNLFVTMSHPLKFPNNFYNMQLPKIFKYSLAKGRREPMLLILPNTLSIILIFYSSMPPPIIPHFITLLQF